MWPRKGLGPAPQPSVSSLFRQLLSSRACLDRIASRRPRNSWCSNHNLVSGDQQCDFRRVGGSCLAARRAIRLTDTTVSDGSTARETVNRSSDLRHSVVHRQPLSYAFGDPLPGLWAEATDLRCPRPARHVAAPGYGLS